MELKLWVACLSLVTSLEVITLDVTVQPFKESPGLYYDFIGEVNCTILNGKLSLTLIWKPLITIPKPLKTMRRCLLTFVKDMSTRFGIIKRVV
jgi:hypothetical protein